ncbi:MAG: RusA family crossover junction endodeoxyribonuclease [Methanobrevibacter sp.]|nr:RusA family crossover junction endodeoxyribonuclease [Methanobrevibacter sp.]
MTFILQGETPSKKNSRIMNTKTKRSFPNPRYTQWHDLAIFEMRKQIQDFQAPRPCSIVITFYHGDKRRRDSDNGVSSIMDMLKDAGVIVDDCWEYVRHTESWNEYDKGNAKCEIEINEYKDRGNV